MELFYLFGGFGYCFFVLGGFVTDPRRKYYHKLLTPRVFLFHFIPALLLGIMGLFWLHTAFLLSPLITLTSLFLINFCLKPALGRNVYLIMKNDYQPPDRKWYEIPFAIIILLLSLLGPLPLNSYLFK